MALGTLLIANRGEVALRVMRTASRLGLRTVAVYSDADRLSPHVRQADRAVRIGPAPAAESYLSVPAVLDAAEREGADAVHPGYGFLSENASFARACEAAGLVFVGPSPDVIELMGRKDQARRVAVEAGAPVMPAVAVGDVGPALLAKKVAAELGFPALVKAVAGGGGRGMRVVASEGELGPAIASAAREAMSAFGDPSLFLERYVPASRHLEVQLVGDGSGKVVHLWDRDCSVQRRHQKVVEEAPASVNPEAARARALETAVRLGAHVNYRSLGTVEFLAVGDEVFFLEMNTRLQVEHTVTESVTGLDLVELQLRLAGGEELGLSQADVRLSGHAIEARIYAEDAEHGFLPQTGRATWVRWPAQARVETALEAGQKVGSSYDPMLAKLVAHGASREVARLRLVDALDATAIFGVTTNTGFLRRLVASPRFAGAGVVTNWLDDHVDELGASRAADRRPALLGAALYLAGHLTREKEGGPFAAGGWRLGGPPAGVRVALTDGDEQLELVVHLGPVDNAGAAAGRVVIEGPVADSIGVCGVEVADDGVTTEIGGLLERFAVRADHGAVLVAHHGSVYRFEQGHRVRHHGVDHDDVVAAPLPGILIVVNVGPGDPVGPGQVLGVLESMKMEHALTVATPATVRRVSFPAGSHVNRGDVLFELELG